MIQETLLNQLTVLNNSKTKPQGALGQLEDVALQIGLIQSTTAPRIQQPHIVVFAADHGIAATGLVNPYPQAVTAQMVKNFLAGGAAINVFCRQHNLKLIVVDAGVNGNWEESERAHPDFIDAKMGMGTRNYAKEAAMTVAECETAMQRGAAIIKKIAEGGCNCIGFGEMGIGNTSSASLLMSALLQLPVRQCVGRGTGATDTLLAQKIAILEAVSNHHQIASLAGDPVQLLACVGGYEIAMLCGAYLEAAAAKMVIVVDGFIATAALLLALRLEESVLAHCIFAHCSGENGHAAMLEHLGVKPQLQLGLRLGEGTGAALAMPLIQSAVLYLQEMASFEAAGVATQH